MYTFSHRTSGSPWPRWAGDAFHAYEIDHVFGVPFRDNRYNDSERTLSGRMITYWTNFAKSGYVGYIRKYLTIPSLIRACISLLLSLKS